MSNDLERRIEALERRTGIDAPDPPIIDLAFIVPGESEDDALEAVAAVQTAIMGRNA